MSTNLSYEANFECDIYGQIVHLSTLDYSDTIMGIGPMLPTGLLTFFQFYEQIFFLVYKLNFRLNREIGF